MSPLTGTVNRMKNMVGINSYDDSMRFVGTSGMGTGLMDRAKGMASKARGMTSQYIAGPAMMGMNNLVKAVAETPKKVARKVAPAKTRARTTPKQPGKRPTSGGRTAPPRAKKTRTRPARQPEQRRKRAQRQGREVKKSRGRRPTPRGKVKSIAYAVPTDGEINFVGVGGIDS